MIMQRVGESAATHRVLDRGMAENETVKLTFQRVMKLGLT